ncbi:MAG TPA: thioredoxin family protein [Chitinophagaceae bacterium]|nr:thioredoxin family protein [Chitinophagaceae bacterium]
MQKFMLAVFSVWVFAFSCADKPAPAGEKLKWMTLQEAKAAMEKEKRPILIDLYTDWCGWCKVMDKKTYTNDKVIEYLQRKFYPVKLNAETREALQWGNRSYAYNSSYHTNEFALFLTHGQLSYPTTVIIPVGEPEPQPVPGYLQPAELELIVKYFGEGHYGKLPFETYQKGFKTSW